MQQKTNAMRTLDRLRILYRTYAYETDGPLSAVSAAEKIGVEPQRVFKTLVTVAKSKEHYVFMIGAGDELDLKKAALAAGEKKIEMVAQKDLFALTGYVHGGCSPIGMKKQFRTFIASCAQQFGSIVCSAGRIGLQIELSVEDLARVVKAQFADLTVQ